MTLETDVRYRIDRTLENKGWILNPDNPLRNVYFESSLPQGFARKLGRQRPDYTLLYKENIDAPFIPVGVIEAKKSGADLDKALDQGAEYAEKIGAPLVFAINGTFCKTRYVNNSKSLFLNGQEVKELLKVTEALKYLTEQTNELYTIPKEVIQSRQDMISLFGDLNDVLRGEGLRAGIERFSEFANILFLKLLSEHNKSPVWNEIKKQGSQTRIEYINKIVLRNMAMQYGGDVFSPLLIKKPSTLDDIIERLDPLYLTPVDEDIKGGAFEYFLEKTTSTQNDLGEYFTPRHIVKAMVNLANLQFGERVYDPFCGTGGFLTGAFNYISVLLENNKEAKEFLKTHSIFGREITTTSRIAKMNMILHGDGHSGVSQIDSLENPIDGQYDVVLTNIPFSQKIVKKGRNGKPVNDVTNIYYDGLAKNSGDGVCVLHCFRSLKSGGRMAIVVPEGFLFRRELKPVREFMLNHATLHSVISLPQGVFLPYTQVKTDILYFTDVQQAKTVKYWFFRVRSDGFTLDNNRRKIDEESDIDRINASALSEVHIEQRDTELLYTIGFQSVSISDIADNNYNLVAQTNQYNVQSEHELVELGDVTEIVNGGTPSTKNKAYWGGNINWATIKDVKQKYLYDTERKITQAGLDNSNAKLLPIKTVIFSSRATIGEVCIAERETCTNQGFKNFICKDGVLHPEYLYYVLKYESPNIAKLATGTTFGEVSKSKISKYKIPLPSFEKQKHIVKELERYQRIIDGANQIIQNYFPAIPELDGCPVMKIGNVCFVEPSKKEISNIENIEVSFLPMSDLPEEVKDIAPVKVALKDQVYKGYTYFIENDLLIAKITPCFENGKMTIAKRLKNKIGFGSTEFIVLRAKEGIFIDWVYYCLRQKGFIDIGRETMKGTAGQQRLSSYFVGNYRIPVPSFEIQKKIVEQLDGESMMINNQKKIVTYFEQKIQDRLKSLWHL